MGEETVAFAWLRHYALLIVLFLLAGAGAGWIYAAVAPTTAEAWTIVVETSGKIPPRQLGLVSQAVFSSAATYQPVMARFGIEGSPQRFLSEEVGLRPVPESNTLIVVGRGPTLARAEDLSDAMAGSLIAAFESRQISGFTRFAPQPAGTLTQPSTRTIIVVAALAGLWLGIGVAIVHYRFRRPVLTLERAASFARAETVVVLRGSAGRLRRSRRVGWRDDERNRMKLRRLAAEHANGTAALIAPGAGARSQRMLTRRWRGTLDLDAALPSNDASKWTILVCTPSTGEPALTEARIATDDRRGPVDLLWIR